MTTYCEIPIDLVVPSDNNVRHTFDPATDEDDATLLDSMRVGTLLQPIRVRPHPNNPGHFEIIAGERRYLAARHLQHATIPAVVDDACTELGARRQRFVENAARKNLSAYQHCQALADCLTAERAADPAITLQQLADHLGMTYGSLGRCESVWRSLAEQTHNEIARTHIAANITWAHLNTLARVKDPGSQLKALAKLVRDVEGEREGTNAPRSERKAGTRPKKLPPIYRRPLAVDMGSDPTAPRPPQVRLQPTRSPGKPEFRLTIGCAPNDINPGNIDVLQATLRRQAEAAIDALGNAIRQSAGQG